MRCPFLEEAQVRFCEIEPFRKIVEHDVHHEAEERCSSPRCIDCPIADDRLKRLKGLARCPFLRDSLVQTCTAASVIKFIPYNDSLQSRCNTDAHRYCPIYLQRRSPPGSDPDVSAVESGSGVTVPIHLLYAANHMWIDEDALGICHVGIDSFVASTLGDVERVHLASEKGVTRPTVVLTVKGVDLTLAFPERIRVSGSNLHVRTHPGTLIEDPYGAGWLYEGRRVGPDAANPAARGLIPGDEAVIWVREEMNRLAEFVHEHLVPARYGAEAFALDGGTVVKGLAQHLLRAEIVALSREFFSPGEAWQ